MTTTKVTYTADLSNTVLKDGALYLKKSILSFPFPYADKNDIYVKIDGQLTNDWKLVSVSTLELSHAFDINTLPNQITIERITGLNIDTFVPGDNIRADVLNSNFESLKYKIEELSNG